MGRGNSGGGGGGLFSVLSQSELGPSVGSVRGSWRPSESKWEEAIVG